MNICRWIYIHVYICMYIYICMCGCVWDVGVFLLIFVSCHLGYLLRKLNKIKLLHAEKVYMSKRINNQSMMEQYLYHAVYKCMYVYICVCVYVYVYVYIYIYMCMCVCMCVCVCVCVYVYAAIVYYS
ncbi:hypothetical protein LOAG_12181 [Loa loa]|uniref:Uncharacterized protein n=1 Tax=Loa loa TaxID=7209 RepID=A0A1S0TLS0_LOALO|nr:hypothetical protein LOAG_12181 [Loa loa]EFO16326.1 hypothetical protein LOAG_12181 [Loa loa]